jgi:hypothetical protein
MLLVVEAKLPPPKGVRRWRLRRLRRRFPALPAGFPREIVPDCVRLAERDATDFGRNRPWNGRIAGSFNATEGFD